MWELDRPTVRRVARCSAIRIRVFRARRILGSTLYLLIVWLQLLLLGFLDHDALVEIAHAFALVRLGRPIRANFGRALSNLLLVIAFVEDLGLNRCFAFTAIRLPLSDRFQ